MIPQEFKNRIRTQKYIDADLLLKALDEPSPVSIRLNTSKWNKIPVDSEPVPWTKNGFYLRQRPSFTLDPLFHSGCYYPQEASGMFLEQVIRQTSSETGLRVLDLCAAPGGKTALLSNIIGSGSLLVSNDAIRQRAAILSETATKWGAGNILVTQNDPAAFGKLPGYFDIIVVDAPCSGEGMFRGEIARNEWSPENAEHCSERQKRILMDIWPALKQNGVLVYSTCTFNPAENEENLKWLLEKKEAEIIRLDISDFKGITEIELDGIYGYGFHPDKIRGEGFFISAIRKTGSAEQDQIKIQRRPDLLISKNDLFVAENWTDISRGRFFKWGSELFAAPCEIDEFLYLFSKLKVIRTGTKIAAIKNNTYLPQHDLALSESLKDNTFPVVEVNLREALAFMKRDVFKPVKADPGWNILKYLGSNIGFINNIGNRVNNYFPVEWRIRMNLPESGEENLIEWN